MGETYLDHSFFRRSDAYKASISADPKFSTRYDTHKPKIVAYEKTPDLIMNLIRKTEPEQHDPAFFSLQWTDSKVTLVEIVYALHASGAINNGKADVKQIINCQEETFAIDLGNYSRVFLRNSDSKKWPNEFS